MYGVIGVSLGFAIGVAVRMRSRMTQAHQVATKAANQVVLAHTRPREQSGAFEKFKTTATASLDPGKAV